jgi:Helix-turn-helix domain
MDERLRFVARLLEGEKMAPLCAEFGISRKTGYKIFDRYKDCGLEALTDRSRRPFRQANRPAGPDRGEDRPAQREYPGWGAPRSARSSASNRRCHTCPRSVPSMPSSTPRPRQTSPPAAPPGARHRAVPSHRTQRAVVRRLQRRIHARQPPLLLSPHHHRLREPLPPRRALTGGFQGYLAKPIDPDELVRVVHAVYVAANRP